MSAFCQINQKAAASKTICMIFFATPFTSKDSLTKKTKVWKDSRTTFWGFTVLRKVLLIRNQVQSHTNREEFIMEKESYKDGQQHYEQAWKFINKANPSDD